MDASIAGTTPNRPRYVETVVSWKEVTRMRPGTPVPVAHRIVAYLHDFGRGFPPLGQRLLAAIATFARNESGVCWPGSETLAAAVGCHPNSVSAELRRLKAAGVLTVVRKPQEHPEREWAYVLSNWADYWHYVEAESDRTDSPATQPTEILPHRTQNSGTQNSITRTRPNGIAAMPEGDEDTNQPSKTNRSSSDDCNLDAAAQLRVDVANDVDANEQAHVCLLAGVDVKMIRWLLRRYPLKAQYSADLLRRMEAEAHEPAAWIVTAMIKRYAAVSDVVTYASHKRRSAPLEKAADADVELVKSRWHALDADTKSRVRKWMFERYGHTPIGRMARDGRISDERGWRAVDHALRDLALRD